MIAANAGYRPPVTSANAVAIIVNIPVTFIKFASARRAAIAIKAPTTLNKDSFAYFGIEGVAFKIIEPTKHTKAIVVPIQTANPKPMNHLGAKKRTEGNTTIRIRSEERRVGKECRSR